MASDYPTSIDNFTDPSGTSLITSPDHAGLHTDVNDAINSIETTLGTTSGTSVLKNISVGKFALAGSADTFQKGTITTSTFNNGTIGTPSLTGGTAVQMTLGGTTKVGLGSDATGDIYYGNGGTLTRLAVGTANQYLSTNGTIPTWTTSAVTFTEAIGDASSVGTAGAWEDWNINATAGANKIAFILIQNTNASTQGTAGVRTNGSSLERKYIVGQAPANGYNHILLPVLTDGSGIIERYSSLGASLAFYLVGAI